MFKRSIHSHLKASVITFDQVQGSDYVSRLLDAKWIRASHLTAAVKDCFYIPICKNFTSNCNCKGNGVHSNKSIRPSTATSAPDQKQHRLAAVWISPLSRRLLSKSVGFKSQNPRRRSLSNVRTHRCVCVPHFPAGILTMWAGKQQWSSSVLGNHIFGTSDHMRSQMLFVFFSPLQ